VTGSSWTAPGGCGCGAASSWRSANPRSIGALCWSDCVSMPLIPITASGRSWRVGCGVLVRLPVGCPVDRGIVASRRCSLMTSGAHDCSRRCIAAVVSCACPLDRFTASLAICSSVEIAKRRRRSLVSADKPNASIVRPLSPYGEAMEPVDCLLFVRHRAIRSRRAWRSAQAWRSPNDGGAPWSQRTNRTHRLSVR